MDKKQIISIFDKNSTALGKNLFRKQLLKFGDYVHPLNSEMKMSISPDLVKGLVDNFKKGVVDNVPIPRQHTDDPKLNTGYAVELEETKDGLDVIFRTDDATAKDLRDGKIPGISASYHPNYVRKDTGEKVGPVLLHAALVNHPYIKGMGNFEEVIGLSEEDRNTVDLYILSEKGANKMNLSEIKELLKKDFNIDLEALQTTAAKVPGLETQIQTANKLSENITTALKEGKVELSENGDIVASVKKVLTDKAAADAKVVEFAEKALNTEADAAVAVLLSEGKIIPAQKEKFVNLFKKDKEMFTDLTKDMKKVVDLTEHGQHKGVLPGANVELSEEQAAAEVKRILEEQGIRKAQ